MTPGYARPTAIGPWLNSRRSRAFTARPYHYGQAAEKALKALLISLGSLPPYSHALERLVDSLESAGLDAQPLRELRLKALSRMNSETRYPSDSEAPVDRFDQQDSEQARSVAEHALAFAKASLKP